MKLSATVTDAHGRTPDEMNLEAAKVMAQRHADYAAANPDDVEAKKRSKDAAAVYADAKKKMKGA